MQGMCQKEMGQVLASSLTVSLMMIVLGSSSFAQIPSGNFRYVFPVFNSQTRSELILSNLGSTAVTAEITLDVEHRHTCKRFCRCCSGIPTAVDRCILWSFVILGFCGCERQEPAVGGCYCGGRFREFRL